MTKSISNIITILLTILIIILITWGVLIGSVHLLGLNIHITFKQASGITILLLYLSYMLNMFGTKNGR